MLWPLQCLFRFVSGPDVLKSILGWDGKGDESKSSVSRLFVLAAEHDVLCTPAISRDAALWYRAVNWELGRAQPSRSSAFGKETVGKEGERYGQGKEDTVLRKSDEDGVRFCVIPGLGHHLQNHVEWEMGAREIEEWVRAL